MGLAVVFSAVLLVVAFALVFGAQVFDTYVNVPVFFADPPRSISKYISGETLNRVPAFFIRTVVLMLVSGCLAIAAAAANGGPVLLAVAGGCALLYVALIFVVFVPTNRKLGFLPGGKNDATPEEIVGLVRQWRAWNMFRILLQASGLIAAAISLYMTK